MSTTQFLHPDPSRVLLAPSIPSFAKNFLHAPLNNLSLSSVQVRALCFPLGDSLSATPFGWVPPQRKFPSGGKRRFSFAHVGEINIFPPRGKASLKDFALPERVTLLRALRALRTSFVISVQALGRGESAHEKYLNRDNDIFTYRFPSPVGCVSPPLPPMAQRRPPCRTWPLSKARSGRLAQWLVLLRLGPLPVGSCRDNPPRGKPPPGGPHREGPPRGSPHRSTHIWEAPTGLLGLSAEGTEEGSPASPPFPPQNSRVGGRRRKSAQSKSK